jgi:hypothetical protein
MVFCAEESSNQKQITSGRLGSLELARIHILMFSGFQLAVFLCVYL